MNRPITRDRLSGVVRWLLVIGVVGLALMSVPLSSYQFNKATDRIIEESRSADFEREQYLRWIGCLLSELQKVGTTGDDVRQCDLILSDEDRQMIERVRR